MRDEGWVGMVRWWWRVWVGVWVGEGRWVVQGGWGATLEEGDLYLPPSFPPHLIVIVTPMGRVVGCGGGEVGITYCAIWFCTPWDGGGVGRRPFSLF